MNYFYEAIDTTGNSVVGKIEATDETEVQNKLAQMGYRVQSVAASQVLPPVPPPVLPSMPEMNQPYMEGLSPLQEMTPAPAGQVVRTPILDSPVTMHLQTSPLQASPAVAAPSREI